MLMNLRRHLKDPIVIQHVIIVPKNALIENNPYIYISTKHLISICSDILMWSPEMHIKGILFQRRTCNQITPGMLITGVDGESHKNTLFIWGLNGWLVSYLYFWPISFNRTREVWERSQSQPYSTLETVQQ